MFLLCFSQVLQHPACLYHSTLLLYINYYYINMENHFIFLIYIYMLYNIYILYILYLPISHSRSVLILDKNTLASYVKLAFIHLCILLPSYFSFCPASLSYTYFTMYIIILKLQITAFT